MTTMLSVFLESALLDSLKSRDITSLQQAKIICALPRNVKFFAAYCLQNKAAHQNADGAPLFRLAHLTLRLPTADRRY